MLRSKSAPAATSLATSRPDRSQRVEHHGRFTGLLRSLRYEIERGGSERKSRDKT
jgi:hypothetical protein